MISFLLLITVLLLLIVTCLLLLRTGLMVVTVLGESMAPTLLHGDRVLVLRSWLAGLPRKNQLVVMTPFGKQPAQLPRQPAQSHYIKRVVALAGESFSALPPRHPLLFAEALEVTDVQTQEAADTWSSEPDSVRARETADQPQMKMWHIPLEHVFVCGDNREYSTDSRSFGPVPLRQVRGVVIKKLKRTTAPASLLSIPDTSLAVGEIAPPFVAQTIDGRTLSLHDFAGQKLLLLCTPYHRVARANFSSYLDMAFHVERLGVAFLFVTSDELDRARLMVEEQHIQQPVLVTPEESHPFYHDYRVQMTPSFCLIDEDGRITASGAPVAEDAALQALLS
jgi:signal peptidase I